MKPSSCRLLLLLIVAAGGMFAAACSTPQPTAPPAPTAAAPQEVPISPAPAATSEGGVMAIAEAGPAVQVLSGIGDNATFVVGQSATITLIAADSNGISKVELWVDGLPVQSWPASGETTFRTELQWVPATEGTHQVGLLVLDSDGVPSQASRYSVTILPATAATAAPPTAVPAATPADTIPPAVSITADSARIDPGQDFDIYTNAVDELGVVKLELYIGGVVRDQWQYQGAPEDVEPSVFKTLIWRNVPEGRYSCYVLAWDTAGNVGQSVTIDLKAKFEATPTPLTVP